MVTYALDSSALLRFFDHEAGGDEVAEILRRHVTGRCAAVVAALHWGETAGVLCKRDGRNEAERVLARLKEMEMHLIPATADRAVRAAMIQAELKIPYVDAFGVELAESMPCSFVTADYDLKPAADKVEILFLPKK